jgi:hypothetical protein
MSHKYNKDDDYKRDIRADGMMPTVDTSARRRRPSRFWLLALSFLPGLSHIYMGLIRRGLFYISALALVIFFTSVIVPILNLLGIFAGFSIVALYAVSFFEAFSIRRDIIMGKEVKDALPNLAWLGGNKAVLILIAVIFAIALGINILARLPWYAWLILGIVAVCYAPYLRRKKGKKLSNDENGEN